MHPENDPRSENAERKGARRSLPKWTSWQSLDASLPAWNSCADLGDDAAPSEAALRPIDEQVEEPRQTKLQEGIPHRLDESASRLRCEDRSVSWRRLDEAPRPAPPTAPRSAPPAAPFSSTAPPATEPPRAVEPPAPEPLRAAEPAAPEPPRAAAPAAPEPPRAAAPAAPEPPRAAEPAAPESLRAAAPAPEPPSAAEPPAPEPPAAAQPPAPEPPRWPWMDSGDPFEPESRLQGDGGGQFDNGVPTPGLDAHFDDAIHGDGADQELNLGDPPTPDDRWPQEEDLETGGFAGFHDDDRIHGDGGEPEEHGDLLDFSFVMPGPDGSGAQPSSEGFDFDIAVDTEPQEAGHFSTIDLRDRVVIMLLFKQMVPVEIVERAWRTWKKMTREGSRELLWRILAQDPEVDRERIYAEAAQVYAFKEAVIRRPTALQYLRDRRDVYTEDQWTRMQSLVVAPIDEEKVPKSKERRVIFVSHDPTRTEVHRLVKELKLESFELQYAPESDVSSLLAEARPKRNQYLDRMSEGPDALDLGTSYDSDDTGLLDEEALEAEISRSSLINLFEASLLEAVRQGASDVHIFPNPNRKIEIHFRVDGELVLWHLEERVHPEAFLAVVKDNATNVDRFERDSAQDGFIQRKIDDTLIRYRVSVLPVANANQDLRSESIVIRVLDDRKVVTDLRKLGLLQKALERFEWAINQPHGMVILTGPTGSGKSTTLFAALHQVVTPKKNVLTVEDPVEYIIPGVRQIKLNHKLGLEDAIRAILRHDPDIVMVGEMRDRPTAELAVKLANTGHLTFSTLHTNDAPSAVSRLYKMGVEPFLIAYAINLVVAQRLVRKLCDKCKVVERDVDVDMLSRLGYTAHEIETSTFYEAGTNRGCTGCGGAGYKGRRAITETLPFSKEIRRIIVTSNEMIDEDAIREAAVREGMLTLRDSAREYVKLGETSVEEMIRVTAGEH